MPGSPAASDGSDEVWREAIDPTGLRGESASQAPPWGQPSQRHEVVAAARRNPEVVKGPYRSRRVAVRGCEHRARGWSRVPRSTRRCAAARYRPPAGSGAGSRRCRSDWCYAARAGRVQKQEKMRIRPAIKRVDMRRSTETGSDISAVGVEGRESRPGEKAARRSRSSGVKRVPVHRHPCNDLSGDEKILGERNA